MNTYPVIRTIASALVSLALAACGIGNDSEGGALMCIPGIQVSCPCPNEEVGYHVCADDGSSFGACQGCAAPLLGCSSDAECGASTPCAYYRCDEQRECVVYHVPYGTRIADKDNPGNCMRWSCDGAGNEVRVYDPSDPSNPSDGGTCVQ